MGNNHLRQGKDGVNFDGQLFIIQSGGDGGEIEVQVLGSDM